MNFNIDKIIENAGFGGVGSKARKNLANAIQAEISEKFSQIEIREMEKFEEYKRQQLETIAIKRNEFERLAYETTQKMRTFNHLKNVVEQMEYCVKTIKEATK